MKKIFAIAMLVLLLFNMGGYMLVFQYFIYRSDSSVYEQINNNHYRPTDLVEIKLPVNFKTIDDEHEYAPVSGQVKLNDTTYNFAYLKMTKDTMYMLVIPNHEKGRLKNAKIVYSRLVTDIPVNEKSHLPLFKKSFFESDFYFSIKDSQVTIFEDLSKIRPDYTFLNITKAVTGIPGQPPDFSATLS